MTAAKDVLGTVELLEAILLQLPSHALASMRGVSRTWNKLIQSSAQIRLLTKSLTTESAPKSGQIVFDSVPTYASGSMLTINPTLRCQQITFADGPPIRMRMLRFTVSEADEPKLHPVRREFATAPACQDLLVCHLEGGGAWRYPLPRHDLHVEGGIRIGHLVETYRMMALQAAERNGGSSKKDSVVEMDQFMVLLKEKVSEEWMTQFKRINGFPLQPCSSPWHDLPEGWQSSLEALDLKL